MYRILIVDDEPIIRKGIIKLIEQSVFSFDTIGSAENGAQALEKIREVKPHFLITDIRMPVMNGLELCKQVSKNYPEIQTIVLSGYDDFQYAQKSLSLGVKEYLLKPITKKKIHEALEKLIDGMKLNFHSINFSIIKLNDWVGQVEDAIWSLESEKLEQLLATFIKELADHHFTNLQKKEILNGLYNLLVQKLNTRDLFSFPTPVQFTYHDQFEDTYSVYQKTILSMMDVLKKKRAGSYRDFVDEAKLYIEDNLAKEVHLEEIAAMLGLNPSYFSQLFKQRTNETFTQYKIKRRMEKAKQLLENSRYRITDISYEIGYSDHPHFTKTFKKYVGCSPSEYRRKLGIM